MSPLSALRTLVPPVLRPPTPAGASPGAAVGAPIPTRELQALAPGQTLPSLQPTARPSFENELVRFVGEVNARQSASAEAVRGLAAGEDVPLHQAVIAMEEASVSFQLLVEVRNKLLESYQELMRMQI